MKKFFSKILLSKYFINFVNYFLVKILKLKNILDSSYTHVGKFFLVNDKDLFVLSYPKSGNTWVRLIVGNIYFKNLNYNNVDQFLPETYFYKESTYINKSKKLRIFKSHDYFDHRFKKVIYVVRDPREVLVSSYYFLIKIGVLPEFYSKRVFFKEFLNDRYNSNFGSWEENVGSWYHAKKKNILFIRYEDLVLNAEKETSRILNFLGKKLSKSKIRKIIKDTSFKVLKKHEKQKPLNWRSIKRKNDNHLFFRSGKIDSWKKFLTQKENLEIKKNGLHL